jgi:hypothetical protein
MKRVGVRTYAKPERIQERPGLKPLFIPALFRGLKAAAAPVCVSPREGLI